MSNRDTETPQRPTMVGPIVAISIIAIVACVLLGLGVVTSWWWLLVLAVAAPAFLEVTAERHRTRAVAPQRRQPLGAMGPPPLSATQPVGSPPAGPAATLSPQVTTSSPTPQRLVGAPPPGPSLEDTTQPRSSTDRPVGAGNREVSERSMSGPITAVTAIQIPKSTNDQTTCEDAVSVDPAGLIIAVSDGASSAFMSRAWANVLVSGFIERPPAPNLSGLREWTHQQSARWAQVAATASVEHGSKDWWNEESTARGSSATLLGLQLTPRPSGCVWSAVAIGDTVVAHVRPNLRDGGVTLIRAFPIEVADAFDMTPELLPTSVSSDEADLPALRFSEGTAETGDSLLVMTDALAQWAFRHHGNHLDPWTLLLTQRADELDALVAAARQDGSMVDDDVTLARITLIDREANPGTPR